MPKNESTARASTQGQVYCSLFRIVNQFWIAAPLICNAESTQNEQRALNFIS